MPLNQFGVNNFQQGAIVDQTVLLQDIRDGLQNYNSSTDPIIDMFSETTIRQTLRVSQAPKVFMRDADGGSPESSKMLYRLLNVPLDDWSLGSQFTVKWLQDALPSDIYNEVDGAMRGDVELNNALFFRAIFLAKTAGSVGTPYQAGFWNGETDVPAFKNNSFAAAHYHYLGANTTVYTLAVHRAMKTDIQEHGYGLSPGSLHLFINTSQVSDVMALVNSNTTILQAVTGQRERGIDAGLVGTGIQIEGVTVHVDDNVPAGYVAMLSSDVKPLARRVHFNPAYQGLQLYNPVTGMSISDFGGVDFPMTGTQFLRRVGFAGQYLGAGTCRQLVPSTSYTNPSFRLGN
jgi:hypothetical protein